MISSDLSYLLVGFMGVYFLWQRLRARLESKTPFEGHFALMRKPFQHTFDAIQDCADENGHASYWIGPTAYLAVTKWQDARKVFINETHRKKVPVLNHHLSNFIGRYNILNLQAREWKVHRASITKAFSPTYAAEFQKIMVQVIHTFAKSVRQKVIKNSNHQSWDADVEQLMKMITMDVFGLAALDTDFGCCKELKSSEFADSFEFLSNECSRRMGLPLDPFARFYNLPCEQNRQHAKAFQEIRSFCEDKIQQQRKLSDLGDNNLITRLIQGQLEAKERLREEVSNEVITDLLMSLLFAGYETTSLVLVYAFFCVVQHPEVEENCIREIEYLEHLTNPDDLVYCMAVILETARLYPPAHSTTRYLQKPLQLSGGYTAPKGAVVLCPNWALHRQEDAWPEPEFFRPQRWVKRDGDRWVERGEDDDGDGCCIAPANRKAFFAFGAGGRSCPGQAFAQQEAVLVLANLLKEFKFRLQPGYKLNPIRDGVVQHPENGMPMTIEFRKKSSN